VIVVVGGRDAGGVAEEAGQVELFEDEGGGGALGSPQGGRAVDQGEGLEGAGEALEVHGIGGEVGGARAGEVAIPARQVGSGSGGEVA
jgi:hypothetical protein